MEAIEKYFLYEKYAKQKLKKNLVLKTNKKWLKTLFKFFSSLLIEL